MHGFSGKAAGRRAEKTSCGGVGKADQAAAVNAADAVGDRVEEDLLLPREFFGSAAFVGARQHLAQGCGNGFDGRDGLAVFAQRDVTIEFEHGQHFVPFANRNGPTGNHLVSQSCLNSRAGRDCSEAFEPDRPAILPGAAGKIDAHGNGEPHAFLDKYFSTAPGNLSLIHI